MVGKKGSESVKEQSNQIRKDLAREFELYFEGTGEPLWDFTHRRDWVRVLLE